MIMIITSRINGICPYVSKSSGLQNAEKALLGYFRHKSLDNVIITDDMIQYFYLKELFHCALFSYVKQFDSNL